jgi:UPF0755 protein
VTLDTPPNSTQPHKRAKWPLLLLLLVLLAGGGLAFKIRRDREAAELRKWGKITLPERMARVPADWSAQTLASRLEKTKKIRDADAFREAAAEIGLTKVAAGGYLLPAVAGPRDLAAAFKNGPTHEQVTFPEGFTALQIAARLERRGFASGAWLAKAAYPTGQEPRYEGRLFPDTYVLPLKATGPEVTATMTDRWKAVVAKLPRPFPKVNGKELSTMEVVTLASIVEREAGSAQEMPIIAGILLERLRLPMRLQVDATIQYARILSAQNHKKRLFFADLEINSPYNTYKHDGLPPTPICNPGSAALKAAARPQATKALFYVYSPKVKHHLYATTFAEHKRNNAIVRREQEQIENAAIEAGISDAKE